MAAWCVSLLCAQAQPSPAIQSPAPARLVAPAPRLEAEHPEAEIVREIDDPHTGGRWLLEHDRNRPGGPGRLVPAGAPDPSRELSSRQARTQPGGTYSLEALPAGTVPVIHAGERLIVEEDTPVVEARLEAVALSPALAGGPLRMRLVIGGRVIRGIAVAAGRAKFAAAGEPGGEVRP
ncbi:MAG TPA: hypothetical protein VGG26_11440 [Terracidiphilus sp.]